MKRATVAVVSTALLFAVGFSGPATAKSSKSKRTSVVKTSAAGECVLVDAKITLLGTPLRVCV
jgi:hypothetical protein